jgi:hypothetical protein
MRFGLDEEIVHAEGSAALLGSDGNAAAAAYYSLLDAR